MTVINWERKCNFKGISLYTSYCH